MNRSKKLMSVLLALVLLCALLPGPAARAEEPPQTAYTISVQGGRATDLEGNPIESAAPDTTVFLEAQVPEGKYLAGWTVSPESVTVGEDGSFTMPAADVTASADFADQQTLTLDLTESSQSLTDLDAIVGFLALCMDEESFEDGEERSYDLDEDGADDITVRFQITETPDPEEPENPDKVTREYAAVFEALEGGSVSGEYLLQSEDQPYAFRFLFAAASCTVHFDPNGGSGSMEDVTVKKGEELTLPECSFTPPANMEFDKWDLGAPGEKVEVTGDMTVKAIWKGKAPTVYTVTFDPGEGSGSMNPRTVKKGAKLQLPECSFTPPVGKTFDKWDVGAPGEEIEVGGDMTVKAVWKWVNYTVTFEVNGGSLVPTQVIQHGQKATKPVDPTQEGYKFEGWFTDKEGKTAFDFETPITGNITLYAKWKEVPKYEVVEGANTTWTKGAKVDKKFVVHRTPKNEECFSHFQDLVIDGKTMKNGTDYTAESGSTVVTLKAAALQKLPAGKHTVTFVFNDGQTGTNLTIRAGAGSPRTGDTSTTVWVVLLSVSALALVGGGAYYVVKKRKQGKTDENEP